jgi:hypothetical protein
MRNLARVSRRDLGMSTVEEEDMLAWARSRRGWEEERKEMELQEKT